MILDDDGSLFLLALGPAGATGLYWMLYRYYRNTDKSHSFERETAIDTKAVTGMDQDQKIDEIHGTQNKRIEGDNVHEWRQRVERIPLEREK